MTKRIFRGIFLVSFVTMLLCLVFIIGVQYQYYAESQTDFLKNKAELIINSVNVDPENLEKLKDTEERITLISPDGTVLFDNKSDISKMENHSDREEIREAIKNGSGFSYRNSGTLSSQLSYYAVRLENGNILRLAESRITITTTLLRLLQPICAIMLFSIILSLILANIISKNIVKPINQMNLENPEIQESYDEIAPLITKINAQNRKIRRQIENLKQNKREFETIASNMSEGLILTDANGQIISCNTSAKTFFGSENIAVEGKNILTFNRSEVFREIIKTVTNCVHISKLVNINKKYFEITASPVLDSKYNLCGAVVLIVDVTEKESREKLRREFTANVSHELKTPLTSIFGISDMLKTGMVDADDVKSFGEDINKESGRLITLVNDIIKLSQLDEGVFIEESEKCDIKAICEDVIYRLSNVAQKNNITFSVSCNTFLTEAPSSLLTEMIYNLCDNAIKYNKTDGKVKIKLGEEDNRNYISISDTGIGIDAKYLDRIFERFYRVDKSRSKQIGGTGLGLSIVKHIAAGIGAQIEIKSKVDKGTTVKIIFK